MFHENATSIGGIEKATYFGKQLHYVWWTAGPGGPRISSGRSVLLIDVLVEGSVAGERQRCVKCAVEHPLSNIDIRSIASQAKQTMGPLEVGKDCTAFSIAVAGRNVVRFGTIALIVSGGSATTP